MGNNVSVSAAVVLPSEYLLLFLFDLTTPFFYDHGDASQAAATTLQQSDRGDGCQAAEGGFLNETWNVLVGK